TLPISPRIGSTPIGRLLGTTTDSQGNIYVVAETFDPNGSLDQTVIRIGADGRQTVLNPILPFQHQYGGLAADGQGNLYVADLTTATVVKRNPLGAITTIAGTGTPGFSGDNGPATQAQIRSARVLAVDSQGYLYIDDQGNNRIRRVSPDGIITTIAGDG